MKKMYFFAVVAAVLLLQACASLTGFEEARTVGEGNSEINVSLNFTALPTILIPDDEGGELSTPATFPNIDFNYRYGITEKVDVGARFTTNLNFGAFVKAQLFESEDQKLSVGTGLEFASALGLLYNVQLPVFISFYPTDNITFNVSPRGVYQFATGDFTTGINYLGANAGLLFGTKNKFGLDIGYYTVGNSGGRGTLFVFGVGGKFKIIK